MFGKRLKALRREREMTQVALADELNLSSSTIGMYEQNRRSPDAEMLKQMADYFDVSIDYLLGRTDDPTNYDDFDLIADLQGYVLDHFEGDVKKAVAFQRAVDEDAKSEQVKHIGEQGGFRIIDGRIVRFEDMPEQVLAQLDTFIRFLIHENNIGR